MSARTISLAITADVRGLVTNLHTAQAATQQFATNSGTYIARNSAAIGDMSNKVGLLGAGLVGMAAVAVKAFADYDAKMAQVQSLTHGTASDMGKLRDATTKFATDFGVSASQAADAELELVKAGVSVADITGGALKGALTLAAAGQLDVADATSIAASAMTQFGLSGKDVPHIADLLAAGADKALGSVQDLGQGLKYAGPVAAQLGISIEDTVGVLSEFAQNGILADQAGTGLRGTLQALVSPSTAAQKVMDKYGITMFDAQGKFKGMANLAGELHDKLGGLTDAQKASALGTIFGNQQITTATILMQGGAQAVDKWSAAVDAQGFAAEQAKGKLGSLNGDLEKLKASLTNALIGTGQGANGPLRSLVQDATDLVSAFNDLSPKVKTGALAIAGITGGALLAAAGVGKLVVGVVRAKEAFNALGVSTASMKGALGKAGMATAAVAASYAIVKLTDSLAGMQDGNGKAVKSVEDTTSALLGLQDAGSVKDLFDLSSEFKGASWAGGGQAWDSINNVTDALDALTGSGTGRKLDLWTSKLDDVFGTNIINAVSDSKDAFDNVDSSLSNLVSSGHADQAADAFNTLYASVDKTKYSTADVMKQLPQYAGALQSAKNETAEGASATDGAASATDKYAAAVQSGTASSADYASALQEQADALKKAAGIVLDARSAERDYQQAIDDAASSLKKNGRTLDDNTAKGRDNQAALDKIASSGLDVVDSLAAQGASQKRLQGAMASTRSSFIDAATAMGLSKAQAKKLADQLGLIPKNVKVQVDAATDAAAAKIAALKASIAGISQWHINANVSTANAYAAISTLNKALNIQADPIAKHATGGEISGPGSGTSDSILARLSNGEFVVNASSYKKYGPLVKAINADALPGFANGGAVYNGHSLAYWQDKTATSLDIAKMKQTIKGDQDSLKEKEKYGKGDKLSRYVLRGIDRTVATKQLAADRKALSDAEYANRLNKNRHGTIAHRVAAQEAQASAQSDFNAGRTPLVLDARRGSLASAITGGLDSALGVTDQARTESQSSALSQSQRTALSKAAATADSSLTSLYKQASGIETKLDAAKDHLADMQQIAAAAADTIKGTFNLGAAYNATGTQKADKYGNSWYDTSTQGYTSASLLTTGKSQAASATSFASGLSKLQGKLGTSPASSAIVQQALSTFGSDPAQGVQFVNALNSMSSKDLSALKGDYNTVASAGASAGQSASAADSAGGLAAANKSANDLSASLDAVNKSIAGVGTTLTNAMLKPYGLKLDSKDNVVKRAMGGWVTGPGTSTSDSIHLAASNGEFVVNAASAKANAGMLEWINSRPATTVLPARPSIVATATSATLPPIYVQNPFTGEYLLAQVSTVAGRVVASHAAAQDQKLAYTGVTAWQ